MLLGHADSPPSPWVRRFAGLIRPGGTVLDVACGSGRHVRWLASRGHVVTGVDRDAAAVAPLRDVAEVVVADIEGGPWPLPGRAFDAVLVTNYLWRALMPTLRGALAPGGVLIYETFATGQQTVGKPSRADFLLRSGELLQVFAGLRVVAYEDGFEAEPARFVQRLVAVDTRGCTLESPRYGLQGPAG
jgi:SAM-dependent methyltransferase